MSILPAAENQRFLSNEHVLHGVNYLLCSLFLDKKRPKNVPQHICAKYLHIYLCSKKITFFLQGGL